MLPLISIQILNWNRAEETQRAIQSALEQSYRNIEVVVIDNGSTDNSVELTQKNFPNIKVIELDKNYGCPGGRNRGIQHCEGEYIFYLDNDGVLHKDAVSKAYNIMKQDHAIAVVTGQVYDFSSSDEIDTKITPRSHEQYLHYNFQGGICMHRKSIYEKVGHYPDHFMYGGEEWYLTAKIIDNDLKIIKDESIILWHVRSNMARNRENELISAYYNKLYVNVSLFPLKYALLFIIYFPYKYPKHADKEGVKKAFLLTLPSRYLKVIFNAFKNRDPIKKSTYEKIKHT